MTPVGTGPEKWFVGQEGRTVLQVTTGAAERDGQLVRNTRVKDMLQLERL